MTSQWDTSTAVDLARYQVVDVLWHLHCDDAPNDSRATITAFELDWHAHIQTITTDQRARRT
ncbi:MAG: hypothetical protein ACRDRH_12095 [Pseudonocardia sp.]